MNFLKYLPSLNNELRQKFKGFQVLGTILTKFAESIAFKLGCGNITKMQRRWN